MHKWFPYLYHLQCAWVHLFVCMPHCFTLFSVFMRATVVYYLTLCLCRLPLSVYVCVYVCLWWAGRKSAVKWGDSSNVGQDWDQRDWETNPSALCKSVPHKKQLALSLSLHSPPAEQHTHTHTLRRTPLHTRLSLSTFLFWQIFNVKVCNMPKLKTFAKFWGVFTWTNEAEQLYSVVALSVVIFITLKKSHFAKKIWFFSTFFHKPNKALSYPSS